MKKNRRIYWDTAAATSLDKRVLKGMLPYLTGDFGNPHSLHHEGAKAEKAVEEARIKIAQILSAHPDEIIFTGSGTESDNLAVLGVSEARGKGHIITTDIEHKAVIEPCRYLQKKGFKVTYLKTDKEGLINPKELKEVLTRDTFLISIMMANNEMGAIQPIREVAKVIRHFRKENGLEKMTGLASLPYLHVDACQAPRFLELNVEKLGVDLLTFNGSKIYGPKGVGCLFARRGVLLQSQTFGGGQERGLRSGTLNVPGIVGLAKALEICQTERGREVKRLTKIQSKLIGELKKIPNLKINGPTATPLSSRLPNNINFSIEGFEGEQLVLELDAKGFAVSSGSACSSHDQINNNVRVSLGREVEVREAKKFVEALRSIVKKYQDLKF